jgi:cytochrome c
MRKVVTCGLVFLFVTASSQAGQLHDAAKSGDLTSIAAALDAGADIEGQDKGATPLFLAVRGLHAEAAALLIARGASVNTPSKIGLPITAAVLKSAPDLVRLMLEHGADPNAVARGEPMLHLAVAGGCFECVQALVEAGADVNAVWIRGDPARNPGIITPYHLARHDDR